MGYSIKVPGRPEMALDKQGRLKALLIELHTITTSDAAGQCYDHCFGKPDGDYPSLDNPRPYYYHCDKGVLSYRTCHPNEVFNAWTRKCAGCVRKRRMQWLRVVRGRLRKDKASLSSSSTVLLLQETCLCHGQNCLWTVQTVEFRGRERETDSKKTTALTSFLHFMQLPLS
ncbi:hypothetical protein LSAT2_009810 [Lamellibrachia satsuma]|nr:hypothetical protein LSAT2_009810 [Lamellibrachia satsuma]